MSAKFWWGGVLYDRFYSTLPCGTSPMCTHFHWSNLEITQGICRHNAKRCKVNKVSFKFLWIFLKVLSFWKFTHLKIFFCMQDFWHDKGESLTNQSHGNIHPPNLSDPVPSWETQNLLITLKEGVLTGATPGSRDTVQWRTIQPVGSGVHMLYSLFVSAIYLN